MPVKTYDVVSALLIIQPGADVVVRGNDTDRIEYISWVDPRPTEAEIDAAGVLADQDKADREAEKANAHAEVQSGPAAASLPALQARVTAIEHILGLRSDV